MRSAKTVMRRHGNPVRVLLIGPSPPPYGGVATFTQMVLSSQLCEQFHLVPFDIARRSHRGEAWAKLRTVNIVQGLVHSLHLAVRMLSERPDVVHVPITSWWAFWKGVSFMVIARAFGARVVAHLHGAMFDQYYQGSHPWVRRIIRQSLGIAEVVIVLSEHWSHFVEREIAPRASVVIVPNGIDRHRVDCIQASLPGDDGRYSRGKVSIAGRLEQRKGTDELAHAMMLVIQEVPAAHLDVVGQWTTQEDRAAFTDTCRRLGIASHVAISGAVPNEEVLRCLARASVFALPSHCENLPIAVIEAMASGLPVVATPVGGIPEMVEDGVTGFLVPVNDHQALAERLVQLLQSPELCRSMGCAGRARFEERYSADVVIQRLAEIYATLADCARRES